MHGMFIFPAINCHQKMAVEMGRMTVETGGKFTAVRTNSEVYYFCTASISAAYIRE
jgi:hypothetical protein